MTCSIRNVLLTLSVAQILLSCNSQQKILSPTVATRLPPLQESVVNIPLKIYAKPYLDKAALTTPSQFNSTSWPNFLHSSCDFRYKYRFIRSGLRFSCADNKATITFLGNYQVAASKTVCAFGKQVTPWITGSCGFNPEPMRRVEINVVSTFHFMPDYTIRSSSGVGKISPVDKCTVTALNADITGFVIDNIRSSVAAFGSSLDQTIAGINFLPLIKKIGMAVGRKLPLSSYGYIKINPSAVKVGTFGYIGDTLHIVAGLACYPEVSSDSTNHATTSLLPPLSTVPLEGGFVINANATYTYLYIDSLLTRLVKNKPLLIKRKTFMINQIKVKGLVNNMIELSFRFSGSKSGTVFLTGTPALDVKSQVISLPDLNYSVQSKDIVLSLGKTFFNKRIISSIRKKAVIKMSDVYRQSKAKLDAALNHHFTRDVFTTGNSREIQLTGLVVEKNNLLFQVRATGNMNVTFAK
ncbi:MAG: DUF4403 family protein [Chitinophagaceae bacterium]